MTRAGNPLAWRLAATARTMASGWLVVFLAAGSAAAATTRSGSDASDPVDRSVASGESMAVGGPSRPTADQAVGPGGQRSSDPAPLLGRLTEADLRGYAPWAPLFTTPYVPVSAEVETIRRHLEGVTVIAIVATWCPDSRREVPRFLAIAAASGLPASAITLVGVDRTKKDAEGLAERWGVTRVPTFVFLRDGREIGRVVEHTPAGSTLEAEIARIVAAPGR